ncbi:MAG: hypothetical protein JWO38_2669 [Gemmataceae bacterium]|nr:hypothetical protein [Gemmataceae bacterium]
MRTLRLLVVAVVGAGPAGLLAATHGLADDRGPVPPEADLDKAQETVRALFKAEFTRTKAADRLALGTKLFQQAQETKDDPAARFVLLREARDLAAKAAEPLGVIRAADEMTTHFALRPGEALVPAIDTLVNMSISTTQAKLTAEVLMGAADEARFAGEWDTALVILKGGLAAGVKAPGVGLGDRLRSKVKDAEAMKAEAEKVKDAVAALKADPKDPAANLAVGRFLAFFRQDWEAGIPLLAKGSDEKLQVAAERDAKGTGGTDDDQIAAADSWYDLAATADPAVKAGIQIRAHHWYTQVVGNQSGLNKTRLEKRIAELQPVVDLKADRTRLWAAMRRGVSEGRVVKGSIVGGAFAQKTFEEMPPGGAMLIGFNYTTTSNGRSPHVIQPIYLTPHGESLGGLHGVAGKGEKGMTTKARAGFAVGAIYVRGGGGFDAFKPIYMRITDTGLNPKDSYDGPLVGGTGGGEGTLGGDGGFIVGLHGKVNDKGKIEAMSPISLAPTTEVNPTPKRKR